MRDRVLVPVEDGEPSRRHPGRRGELLHVGLRTLETGPVRARSEDEPPPGPQPVGEAVDERRLRPDDEQIGLDLLRRHEGRRPACGPPANAPESRGSRASRRRRRCERRRARARARGAPRSDDADAHARRTETYCSRPGPDPDVGDRHVDPLGRTCGHTRGPPRAGRPPRSPPTGPSPQPGSSS